MISILIPYYDPEYKKSRVFTRTIQGVCLNSRGEYEIILVKDGPSYVESHNRALSAAHGDYLVVLNDDIEIQDPDWLEKLTADRDAISSWRLGAYHMHPQDLPDAACFGMSRETFEKLGLMDEIYKDGMNYEDTDYFLRAKELGIPFRNADIKLHHYGYETAKNYSTEQATAPLKELNRGIFCKRWMK
jgi:glycosyltransferase involved in cell wall biosynthesis